MGKVFRGAEVTRVYVGSYRDTPISKKEHETLFAKDKEVLLGVRQKCLVFDIPFWFGV